MLFEIWQNEKLRLADRLHQRVLQGRDAVVCREMIGTALPEIFKILVQKRARQLFEEAIRLSNPEFYDLENPVVQDLMKPLQQVLLARTKFSSSEIKTIGSAAIALQYDILVRPRATLCHLLFHSANERSRDEVIVIAEGFGEERPFIKKLVTTLRELHSPRIFRDLFDTLTRTTEQAVFKETPIFSLLTDFKLLMDFESQVTGETCNAISSPVLLGMLVERELDALADGLAQEPAKASWTLAEIESALERFWLVGVVSPSGDSPATQVVYESSTNNDGIQQSLRSAVADK